MRVSSAGFEFRGNRNVSVRKQKKITSELDAEMFHASLGVMRNCFYDVLNTIIRPHYKHMNKKKHIIL